METAPASTTPAKFDKHDRRLLLELDRNARIPLVKLSKSLGMPIETVRYRIQRMEHARIIKNFLTVIDGGRLGFYYYKVFLRLHNVSEKIVQTLIDELSAEPRICWVVRVDGNFDIGFTPRVSNPMEQSALLDGLRQKHFNLIRRWTLSVNIKMDFFARDFIVGAKQRRAVLGSYFAQSEKISLDGIAKKVLDQLALNPRQSAAAIADELDVSSDTVIDRIRQLEKQKVIVRYSLVTDPRQLGQVNYYVLIYLNHVRPEREEAFVKFCAAEPHIVYLIKSLGEWDYEISIEAQSVEDYRTVMMKMTREFSDIIQEYNGMMVNEIFKYVYP